MNIKIGYFEETILFKFASVKQLKINSFQNKYPEDSEISPYLGYRKKFQFSLQS